MPSDSPGTGTGTPRSVEPETVGKLGSVTIDDDDRRPRGGAERPARRLYHLTAIAMSAPIIIDAVRRGAGGWVPTRDAALTVLYAHHSVGIDPRLVGMFAAGASTQSTAAYFPGPWLLWWLWGPTNLLGVTWGPLLAMAVLNIGWMLLAGWTVRRAVGTGAAAGTFLFLGILNWSLGTGMLLNATPMIMVVPPFAAFLFVAWAVVAGDDRALPALAVVANFLVLDHLVFTFVVPAITFAVIGIWAVALVWTRRRDPSRWATTRRRTGRSIVLAVGVSVIAWIPSIIDQLTSDPGNLAVLWRSWRQQPDPTTSVSAAVATSMTVFTRWPFWFRGGLDRFMSPFSGITPATRLQVVVAVTMAVAGMVLAWICLRRRDRAALSALVLGGSVMVIGLANMVRSPGKLLYQWYYLSTWPIAMFVTFAFAFAAVRSLPRRHTRVSYVLVGLTMGVVTVANVPHTSIPASLPGGTDDAVEIARQLGPPVVDALRGQRVVNTVAVATSKNVPVNALMLALDQAGIVPCRDLDFPPSYARAYTRCDPADDIPQMLAYRTNITKPPAGFRVIANASLDFDRRDRARLDVSTREISNAIATIRARDDHLELNHTVREAVDTIGSGAETMRVATKSIAARTPSMDTPRDRLQLASVIDYWARWARGAGLPVDPAFDIPGVSDEEVVAWAELMCDWADSSYSVALGPAS